MTWHWSWTWMALSTTYYYLWRNKSSSNLMLVRRGRNFVRIRKYIFKESCAQHEKANTEKKSNVPTFFFYLDFVTHTFINFWFYLDDACLVTKKWCIQFSFSLFYIQLKKKSWIWILKKVSLNQFFFTCFLDQSSCF